MIFVKKEELALVNGGYLTAKAEEVPVNHEEFVKIQTEAHYLVNLASKVKETDFTTKVVKTFAEVVLEVKTLMDDEKRTYVTKPSLAATPLQDGLKDEAMNWLKSQGEGSKADKLNSVLQKYNLLAEFEEFGLYFNTDKIVKLKKIYTLQEIVDAVTVLEPHLSM